MRLYSLMARQNGYQQRARASQSVPPPLFENSSSTLPEAGILASDQEPKAILRPKGQPQMLAGADLPPIFEAPLGSDWFAVPPDRPELMLLPDVKCPHCRETFVHRSRPRTHFEYLLLASGILLKRCHRCLYRYVVIFGIVFTKRAPIFR